jgi:hypothetical protein
VKKIVAISLTFLLLLNILGYYGLFLSVQYQNDLTTIKKLDDNNYDTRETISIKIPITFPYPTDHENFERVNGQFEHNGQFYRLVKQRLMQDTLHIICIIDHQSKRLHQALQDYVKTFTDKPINDKESAKIAFSLIKEYVSCVFGIDIKSIGWTYKIRWENVVIELLSRHSYSIAHPPERA